MAHAPTIDGYTFGRMRIAGRTFTSDLVVHSNGRIEGGWWRAAGHRLAPADISDVIETAPRLLVVGTGAAGMMKVEVRVLELCAERGIEVVVCRTGEAVERYNGAVSDGIEVAACFHLTC